MVNTNHQWVGAIMAAGSGTRMGTSKLKPLHEISGRTLIEYVIRSLESIGLEKLIVIKDHGDDLVNAIRDDKVQFITQDKHDGTGGALKVLLNKLDDHVTDILLLNSDVPFIEKDSLDKLTEGHIGKESVFSVLVSNEDSANGRGILILDDQGISKEITEKEEQKSTFNSNVLVNVGAYCINVQWALDVINQLETQVNGEIYITELMSFAFKESKNTSYSFVGNNDESLGINTLIDLSNAQKINRKRVLDRLMLAGVIIEDPDSTYIDDTVTVGVDTVIKPGTLLRGDTRIGNNCEIGPGSQIIDSLVAENCRVWNSIIEGSILETNVLVGPYSHIRPESYLSNNVKVGNFSEIKASRLEEGVRMSHFGYIGDASIGARVNLGAGMVTCNYDGTDKNHTTIGEGSFIGSATMLVAPIVIGPGSVTGAGSVVITDVQNGDRVAGVPAKSIGPKN